MAINKTINKRTNTHGAMRNCCCSGLRQPNLGKISRKVGRADCGNDF